MAAAVAECARPAKRQRLGWDQEISWQNQPSFAAWATILNSEATLAALSSKLQPQESKLLMQAPKLSDPHRSAAQASTSSQSPPLREDDKEGHYCFELGENLTPRYKILSKMGEGTFGRVLECWDREAREFVAIKMIRSAQKYRDAAMIEIDVLRVIQNHDQVGSRRCVRLKRVFDYRNHVCMVFEKLGPSLYDFLKNNSYQPFSLSVVRDFGRQLLESVAYMHELGLIHTDLKPENVLLVSGAYTKAYNHKNSTHPTTKVPRSSEIRLIDFGSTTFSTQVHSSSVVSTRHYRAPEVILGMGWSYACDLWSVACILLELCTGDTLFQTHENLEHLAMMERVLGPIPEQMIRKAAKRAEKYFRHGRRLNWPEGASSSESIRAVRKLDGLRDIVTDRIGRSSAALVFLDLLEGMLEYEPSRRFTARQALRHRFFNLPFL